MLKPEKENLRLHRLTEDEKLRFCPITHLLILNAMSIIARRPTRV